MAKQRTELDDYADGLMSVLDEVLPIVDDIALHTKYARKAMGGLQPDGQTDLPVDTLTLSNELVELSILLQRIGDRIARMGYFTRGAKEYYERTREGHKIRLVKEDKIAAGVADSMKLELAHEEFKVYNNCEYNLDKLNLIRKSTDKTIDSIRSKLSYEKVNEQRA